MNGKKNQIALNMFSQIIAFVFSLSINFFLVPLIVNKIGKEIYGFFTLANNFLEYATVITTMINGMANRYITIHYSKGDIENASRYFTSVTVTNIALTLFLSIPAAFIIAYLELIVDVPFGHIFDIKALWIFTFMMFFVNLIFSRYEVAAFAKNRLDVTAVINVTGILLKALLLIIVYAIFPPYIWYIGVIVFVCAIVTSYAKIGAKKRLAPDLVCKKKYFSMDAIKTLVKDGIWNSVSQLSQILFTGLDLLIANIMINAYSMSLLSIAKTLPVMIIGFVGVIAGAFYPSMTIIYSTKSKKEFVNEVSFAAKMCGFICAVPIIGVIAYGKSFFSLWLPTLSAAEIDTVQRLSILTLLPQLLSIYIFPLHQINTITCKVRIPAVLDCVIGAMNIVIVCILLNYTDLGIYAIAGVSSVLLLLRIAIFVPLYASHNIGVSKMTFYPFICRGVAFSIILFLIFGALKLLVCINSWMAFLIVAVISAVLGYLAGFFVVFNKSERKKALFGVVDKIKTYAKEK